jgi:hypothetical protein
MRVFQFGVRVAAPPREEPAGWEPVVQEAVARESLVSAPLVFGRVADAVVESGPATHRALVYFDREAANLAAAIVTALVDLERDGLDCLAVVPDDDLVTLGVIAPRLRLAPRVAGGALRDGPAPVLQCGGERVFRWSEVTARLRIAPGAPDAVLAAMNLALRLRRLVRDDPALVAAVRDLLAA